MMIIKLGTNPNDTAYMNYTELYNYYFLAKDNSFPHNIVTIFQIILGL